MAIEDAAALGILFNKTNFSAPNANISNTNFGTITSTYPARQLQFGLKVLF